MNQTISNLYKLHFVENDVLITFLLFHSAIPLSSHNQTTENAKEEKQRKEKKEKLLERKTRHFFPSPLVFDVNV